jgi:hypothetical protein
MPYAGWLPTKLREWGLPVHEHPGWATRGYSNLHPLCVVIHHTASKPPAVLPSLDVCINGRPDVPGPLCNILIGRDCKVHVLAAGVSNNAGTGGYDGITGNRHTLGVEVENNGTTEPWTDELYATTVLVAAALADGARVPIKSVIGHKEWTPRKIDPRFDMRAFRAAVSVAVPPWAELPVQAPEVSPMDYVAQLATPEGDGSWILLADGAVHTGGNAAYFGGANMHMQPGDRATSIAPAVSGAYGYTIRTVGSPDSGFTYIGLPRPSLCGPVAAQVAALEARIANAKAALG